MTLVPAHSRCPNCKLGGDACMRGEVEAAEASEVWRHTVCGHVIAYRPEHPYPAAAYPLQKTRTVEPLEVP